MQHALTQHAAHIHAVCNTDPGSTQNAPTWRAIHICAVCTGPALRATPRSVQYTPVQHAAHRRFAHGCSGCHAHTQHALHLQRTQQAPSTAQACREGWTDRQIYRQTHTHTHPNSPLLSTLSRTRGSVTNGRGGPGGGRAKGFPAEPSRRCASSPSSSAARHGGSSSSSAAHMAAAGRHRRSAAARRGWGGVDAEHLAAPPGPSERGLRGAEQLIAAAAAYRHGGLRPAGSQPAVCTPPGCVPLLSAPPTTPPRRAAGPQSGVHGWCVSVCV